MGADEMQIEASFRAAIKTAKEQKSISRFYMLKMLRKIISGRQSGAEHHIFVRYVRECFLSQTYFAGKEFGWSMAADVRKTSYCQKESRGQA